LKLDVRREREQQHATGNQYSRWREGFATDLYKDIQDLRDEVKLLEMHRTLVSATIPAAGGSWDTVMGYFLVVRYRLPLSSYLPHLVSKAMSSNVVYNSEYDIEAMIRSWYFLQWFGDVSEKLINLSKTTKY
ncbi:hypothetical protein PHMEG_00024674, partial [Phytophthora megakarya]